jgi:hypothetical protein
MAGAAGGPDFYRGAGAVRGGDIQPVRDRGAVFLTEIDKDMEVLNPAETQLAPDTSTAYQASLLYMESLLRQKAPTDERLYIGHQAAMDPAPFQLDAAIQALGQPRHLFSER